MLAAHLREHPTWFEEFDLLLGVPAFVGPGSRRRWDPLGSVLGRLAVLLPAGLWEVDPVAVVKRFETPAMTGRSRADRRRIAEGPLRRSLALAGRSCVAGARVLVVDDVLTGGSTMQEMGRLLRSAGAVEVAGLVLARPGWGGVPGGAG
jgi:predicted amidophosphoribosyltransferase